MYKNLKHKQFLVFVIVIIIIITLFGWIFGLSRLINNKKISVMENWKAQIPEVTATNAKSEIWYPTLKSIGEAVGIQNVKITSQVSGLISDVLFDSGQIVKKGDVLFVLDTKQMEAEFRQAAADFNLNNITYHRNLNLFAKNAISQQVVDESYAKYKMSAAKLDFIQEGINYHIIKAPFDGKIGLKEISSGQNFIAGERASQLTNFSPIYINFTIPQNNIRDLHIGGDIEFTSDSYPGIKFKAKITAINSEITRSSRAIDVQATYDNKNQENLIYPGMFLNIDVVLPSLDSLIVIPQNAINYTLYGETIYILTPDYENDTPVISEYNIIENGKVKIISTGKQQYTAKQVSIKTTMTDNNKIVVTGIRENDLIVTSGQNKLHDGIHVVINDNVDF